MGTRHCQSVIAKDGTLKIQQYGQWDGYPSGQGLGVLEYLNKANLEKYQKELAKINEVTESQINVINESSNWKIEYPYMSRDCGSDIHQLVENGDVKFVNFISESEANDICEGFYTIDFSKNEFTSEWYGTKATFKLDNLPDEKKYLESMKAED